MLLMPDPSSAILDPATEAPTLSLVCEIADPITREPYAKDPRGVARRAEEHLRASGIADTAYFGPECEFFVFDEVHYDLGPNRSHYSVDSAEGYWNSGKPGLGYTARPKEGYFPTAPSDLLHDLRTEMVLTLERLGIPCEFHHHEVASGGQCEIDLRFTTLTRMADQVMTYKYVVKNVARRHGKSVTFMPKPIYGDNGSGMHTHQSLWMEGTPLDGGQVRLRGALPTRARVHRRPARACPRSARLLRADDELVPAAGPRLRGAGQPRLLQRNLACIRSHVLGAASQAISSAPTNPSPLRPTLPPPPPPLPPSAPWLRSRPRRLQAGSSSCSRRATRRCRHPRRIPLG